MSIHHPQLLQVALVGNPNCGKTTLFNALTGAFQRVGNWPGVTVECKKGRLSEGVKSVEIIDLPGIYSLNVDSESASIDEKIAVEFVLTQQADLIINIVDASNLERHLYLTTQLLESGVPLIVALNMMDVAKARGINIDIEKLEQTLNCRVIPLSAHKKTGVRELKRVLLHEAIQLAQPLRLAYPQPILDAISALATSLSTATSSMQMAIRLLETNVMTQDHVDEAIKQQVVKHQAHIQQTIGEDADILLADTRYQFVQMIMTTCTSRVPVATTPWTKKIDAIVLNRVLGIPIFLMVMYALFFFSINIGGAFQDFFDISSRTIFVDGLSHLLSSWELPTWLIALLANGVGNGINTTVTFIPVIGAMFLFLAFLEDSGYMARAAFVVDRLMRAVGLPGKAFVPMIVGFGCNVPSVMGARTLENHQDRILTIMMSPFMSCGARLAIYAVFTAAFFPQGGQNIVFALYMIGILMAVLTGVLLRQTVLTGEVSPLIMELPAYHVPRLNTLALQAWQRLKKFLFRAGKLIIPICVLLGALNSLNSDGSINAGDGDAHSLLSSVGQFVTPIFSPMGLNVDNWPATVGLVTGVLAKEVVVGTLNTLYTQMGQLTAVSGDGSFDFFLQLQTAVMSIPANLAALSSAFWNPVVAQAPIDTLDQAVYGLMYQYFDGKIGAFAYLLFVLLYFPCISTLAAMLKECHVGWSIFSGCWMTGVAYGSAVFFYQAATFERHPVSSFCWMIAIISVLLATILIMRRYGKQKKAQKNALLASSPIGESV